MLFAALAMPIVIFIFSIGRYYGFYYDNHYFNLLALDLMGGFRPWLYLGSHYTIHSSLYSWLVLPLFYLFGPTDFSMELLSAIFHLGTIVFCFKLGNGFFNRKIGIIFAFLVSIAPIYLLNIYTWPEYSLIAFLNLSSIYYFLTGFSEGSKRRIILSSVLFSLSCSQSIYSIALSPVYLVYALFQAYLYLRNPGQPKYLPVRRKKSLFSAALIYLPVLIAFLYLAASLEAMFIGRSFRILYYGAICLVTFAGISIFNKLSAGAKKILNFSCLFFIITATALLLMDLFIQLDINFFGRNFGYYRDTTFAGGFGTARPFFVFGGAPLAIFGRPLYMSVLSSLLPFSSLYSRVSFSLPEFFRTQLAYYKNCFPPAINIFIIIGIIGILADILYRKFKKFPLNAGLIFALIWLLGITLAFFNAYAQQMLRIYVLPMPYLFAALGVYYVSRAAQYGFKGKRGVLVLTASIVVLFLSLKQLLFIKGNIYDKYKYDKNRSNYFKLFHGWPYGRSYKEAGEFLLKDAPLKERDKFKSILVYTIAGDTSQGICSVFYNNIDWYTRNKIKILYDAKPVSRIKYGSSSALAGYLSRLFAAYPDVRAIYFADFYDTKDNFSFFSKMHPHIKPYKIVNDDDNLDYDCILYKFERDNWQGSI